MKFPQSVNSHVCHVWLANAGDPDRAKPFLSRAGILSAEEQLRSSHFVFDRDRTLYIMARVLVRCALSACGEDVGPADWVFEQDAGGRPEIAWAKTVPALRFNISHTRGLVACIVTAEVDCGIDVERLDRGVNIERLAKQVLAESEIETIARLPEAMRAEYFFRLWTVKEAYAKARGMGLALPFKEIAVEFGPAIRILAGREIETDAEAWQFASWRSSDHLVAMALRRGAKPEFQILVHAVPPPAICLERALAGPSSAQF